MLQSEILTSLFQEAVKIRETEELFLKLFSEGKLNGTIHTCVGQEFNAIAVCNCLRDNDFVVSNHRCHGHYLAFKNDFSGLIAELMGKQNGICGGIGSSQHLFNKNFLSNGIQGGIVPIAAGISFAKKNESKDDIVAVFIGDGTFGSGTLYESLNLISLYNLPLLVVCENNFYAQATPLREHLAGDIIYRVKSFAIETFQTDTWDLENLIVASDEAVSFVRNLRKPAFLLINTYRLNAHSKGDDNRDPKEIELYKQKDLINRYKISNPDEYNKMYQTAVNEIKDIAAKLESLNTLDIENYITKNHKQNKIEWSKIEYTNQKISDRIYSFFNDYMNKDSKVILIGEDVKYPYGGAFKISRDLSKLYPNQVIETPISESAITGFGIGLSLMGYHPFVEIMFGDFITLCMDQIINHAGKFYHQYNKQVKCPVVIRTPMGGRRGYGPTHSQSLEKFLIGIDNVKVIALNTLIDPYEIYETIYNEYDQPVIVIENKTDYNKLNSILELENYEITKSNEKYPTVKISPVNHKPDLTIVTYGGSVSLIKKVIDEIFYEHELISEVFVISKLSPIEVDSIIESAVITKNLITLEEGKLEGGIGSEIISTIIEKVKVGLNIKRIAAEMVPIPSAAELENFVIPNEQKVISEISELIHE